MSRQLTYDPVMDHFLFINDPKIRNKSKSKISIYRYVLRELGIPWIHNCKYKKPKYDFYEFQCSLEQFKEHFFYTAYFDDEHFKVINKLINTLKNKSEKLKKKLVSILKNKNTKIYNKYELEFDCNFCTIMISGTKFIHVYPNINLKYKFNDEIKDLFDPQFKIEEIVDG